MQLQNTFIHHVFFWLKENNQSNREQLIEGLKNYHRCQLSNNTTSVFLQTPTGKSLKTRTVFRGRFCLIALKTRTVTRLIPFTSTL